MHDHWCGHYGAVAFVEVAAEYPQSTLTATPICCSQCSGALYETYIAGKRNLDVLLYEIMAIKSCPKRPKGWGHLYQMDTGVRLTLPKAGAFGENTVSKNEGSLGEKPNFGLKLGGIGWECYFWPFSERFKSRNLQKKPIENGKNDLLYRWVRKLILIWDSSVISHHSIWEWPLCSGYCWSSCRLPSEYPHSYSNLL